ncbi:hypothetical protein NKI88_02415 [Mesorhizobium sp. M0317]|uniref:hypothetical protein n=1 Tax=Mesorhizobium sp. M0317 TaxID=2956935 RepID=UPI00333547C3
MLEAWRSPDVFVQDAYDCVRAFTLAKSIADQERVFNTLKKERRLFAHVIRSNFGANQTNNEAAKWVKIAGEERYLAAGGAITRDLFGGQHIIADHALAEKVATEALSEQLQALKTAGWSWAAFGDSLPNNWNYNWTKLTPTGKPDKAEAKRIKQLQAIVDKPGGTYEAQQDAEQEIDTIKQAAEARGWSADQMAGAGAVVAINHNGEINTVYGVVEPKAAKAAERAASGGPADKKAPALSNAIANRLSVTATLATRAALLEEPRMGMVALLAAFLTKRYSYDSGETCPLRVRTEGMGQHQSNAQGEEKFGDALARLSAMDDAALFRVGAMIAAQALDLTVQTAEKRPFAKAAGAIAAAIDPKRLDVEMRKSFDAQDYFQSVSKPFAIAAIKAAVNADEAKKAENLKKAELVAYCVTNVPGTGWLPPELRNENYAGPM